MASASWLNPRNRAIGLAQAVSEFVADLSDEQKREFRMKQLESLPPKDKDIIAAIAEIHEVAAPNQASNVLRFEPRMTNFLKAVQEFASLQDDTPAKLLSPKAGDVWLLVRLTFTRLARTPRWLEAVSELFMGSCRSSPFDMKLSSFDSHSEQLRWCLCQYYFIVVRICHYLFLLQPRPGHAETISFSADSTMMRNKSALEKCTVSVNEEMATLKRQHQPSNPIDCTEPELGLEKYVDYLQLLGMHINYDYITTWTKIWKLGSTSLFAFEPSYERFTDCSGSSTLLYSGNRGAGKSVILANMVHNLSQRYCQIPAAFCFFRSDEVDYPQALVILRAIFHQVLKGLLLTSYASHVPNGLRGLSTIPDNIEDVTSCLQVALEAAGKTYLILDGLDECQRSERTKVIEVLKTLQTQFSLSICLSTRPGALTDIGWTNLHLINIPKDNPDVSYYIDLETSRLLKNGKLRIADPALELLIRSALTTAAKGNFVRAKKSMELLCAQKTDSDMVRLLADFREDSNGIDTEAMQSISPTPHAPIAPSGFTDSAYASASLMDNNNKNTNDGPAVDESLQGLDDPTIDDSATEYSDVSSTTFSRKQLYIQELAKDLYNKISFQAVDLGQDHRIDISATLPRLLKAFALKIGYCATTQIHRDVMAFVHRHRSGITAAFLDICLSQREMEPQEIACPTPVEVEPMDVIYPSQAEVEPREIQGQPRGMSLNEVMALWEQSEDREQTLIVDGLDNLELLETEEEDEYEETDIWVAAYRDFAPGTEAYSWLMTQLQRNMDSVLEEPTAIQLIRDQVLSSVPSPHRISRSVSSESCGVLFDLDWDIIEFFDSQEFSKSPDEVLSVVVTLTGSPSDAQASNCTQFLKQTWPTTGDMILRLIRGLLRLEGGHTHECRLPDHTTLTAWINGSKVMVQANGSAASISETGEQLAWLGAALRSSPHPNGLSYCTPSIRSMHQDPEMPQAVVCVIGFELEQLLEPPDNSNGHCWHGIFKNPTLVKGFPILPKVERNTGLEIPLNIMAGLARADRVDQFNGKVYIKGFSTMLVPTKQSKEVVYWHLIYNEDGSRISYLDDNLNRDVLAGTPDLTAHRHVLGWCSEARFYSGSSQAQYHVRHSELPKLHSGCALAGTVITLGRMITGGHSFELGIKDTPIHVARNGYIPRLKWISSKFFLLWDEADKRGWLTNGTSVLLHVVRASLAYDSTDKFQSAFLFKAGDLQESTKPFTSDSAIDVLINSKNLALKLYPEKNGFITLRDRVDQYYNLLEKMLDHQAYITSRHTGSLEGMPRKNLEGWDFEDLSANRDPLHPRLVTLEPAGKGWVDLTRDLQAVTLAGSGFGELIRPAGPALCDYWSQLPRHRYLLACSISDMEDVVRDHRSSESDHTRLSDNLIWHNAVDISGKCQCGDDARHHGEPVHVAFPSALSHKLFPNKSPIKLSGAAVFGHNPGFSWTWGDTGPPTQQQSKQEIGVRYVLDKADKDSGIGESLGASSSESHASPIPSSSISRAPLSLRKSNTAPPSVRNIYSRNEYTVGILCALAVELKAVRALFDQRHQHLPSVIGDNNQYALGEMARHMVVATSLPAGEYGTNAAASAVSDMMRSFTSIQFCLLVGIAGGAPSEDNDIRLGDVVVSLPTQTYPGVIQYDLGKENEGSEFEVTGVLQRPPRILTNAISKIRSDPDIGVDALNPHLTSIVESLPAYGNPGQELDVLSRAACTRRTCKPDCTHLEQRLPRLTAEPMIHYGLVASGNRVVKDATLRDQLSRKHGVLCFEMEAAGVMNRAGCLVIRGICDYSDAQKNKIWQNYAAAVAAAYTKLLLSAVAVNNDLGGDNVRTDGAPMFKKRRMNSGNEGCD
ncbi:related to nucleoside phosphorylase [Fusarium proliferatum]|nr:related to nucleoside phosphorylase [Fusarium proliferatum]